MENLDNRMKIKFTNCDFSSSSGPNNFGLRLGLEFKKQNHVLSSENADVELVFIEKENHIKNIPIIHRLDGIWIDKNSNYMAQNEKILMTYNLADAVVFQSEFDQKLIETFFGKHKNSIIIYNGENLKEIEQIKPNSNPLFDKFNKIWITASDWRPRKRLQDNIQYFLEFAGENDGLVIAGSNELEINHPRIINAGHLPRVALLSLLKRAECFVGLFYLEHCSNIIIQARACGCHIICTDSGGTKEIVGTNSTIIQESEKYDFTPCDLKNPPVLDFSKKISIKNENIKLEDLDISIVASKYLEILNQCIIK